MGFFEDLISSFNNDPYADDREKLREQIERMRLEEGTFYDDTSGDRNKLRNQIGRMQLRSQIEDTEKPSWFSQTPIGQDLSKYTEDGKIQLPFEPGPAISRIAEKRQGDPYGLEGTQPTASDVGGSMHDRAQASIAARLEREAQAEQEAQKAKEYLLKMQEAKAQDDWVRSVGYEPDQTFSDPEKGILVEDINADKLAKIRAQAAKMAGREGPSAGGGGFSQGTMTPEISQRLSERDAWAAQQPMRDAVWDIDVARQRGDTAGQDSAAGRLQSMQQQASIQSKQDAINSLLSKVTDKTGKIDPDTYQKLGMLGQYVPSSMVGKGKEQTLAEFDALIASGSETISQLAPQAVFDPSGETSNRVAAERKGVQLLTQLKQMIANGQMTAEEASATFQQAMMMDKYVQGWLAEKMMPQPGQLQQGE